MDRFLYFDFEYRDNRNVDELVLLAYATSDDRSPKLMDLRDRSDHLGVRHLVRDHQDHIWVAYNDNLEEAMVTRDRLAERLAQQAKDIYMAQVGATISVHTGPGSVCIAMTPKGHALPEYRLTDRG